MSQTLSRLFALSLVCLAPACSSLTAHQQAYAVAAVSKTVIDEADRRYWHPYVESQIDRCDPENNATVQTKRGFDECLGPALADDKVQAALETYVKAAEVLFAVLKSTESDPDDLRSAKNKALDAALAVLALMGPDAGRYLDNLKALTKGK